MRCLAIQTVMSLLLCPILCAGTPLAAQEASSSGTAGATDLDKPEKPPSAEPRGPMPSSAMRTQSIEESRPAIYYLKDKQGNLQAVPNFTLEDFEELYKLKHQLVDGDRRPRYSVQQFSASGEVSATGYVELNLKIGILVREEQWTRIPLRLDRAMLRESAQFQGPGEHFLSFEGDGDGYVAWIRSPAGQQHQITLKMLVPLVPAGQETRLRLVVPRATTSELKLKVPQSKAVAKVSEGATLQTTAIEANATELAVVGLSGAFELSWRPPSSRPGGSPVILEAFGTLLVNLDRGGIETDATFSVRSYGDAFDHFRIALPPDTDLVPGNTNGFTLSAIDGPSAPPKGAKPSDVQRLNGSSNIRRQVEVEFAKRTTGPVEIHLTTKRTCDPTRRDAWTELAGIEVVGASRQWGTIAVGAAGNWQVLWGPNRDTQQLDQIPETVRRKDIVAGFEYSTQSSSLTARLVPRKTRISVEPEYVLFVDRDQTRLEARLRYTVRGAKIFAVEVAMRDWQIDEVGPDSVASIDRDPAETEAPTVTIPLAQPTIGQFEIRLKAHKPIAGDTKSISVMLPQPQASTPSAAIVVVVAADNVEVVPDEKRMAGLLRQQTAVPFVREATAELPTRQQEPLFYRSDAAKAVFAADLRPQAQSISVDVSNRIVLDPQDCRVEEQLDYTIQHEPTDYFVIEVPRELTEKGRLILKYEDQTLSSIPLSEKADNGEKSLRMRIALPKSRIGSCRITALYSIAKPLSASDPAQPWSVPLIMPIEADLVSNKLSVAPAAGQHVAIQSEPWVKEANNLPQLTTSAPLQFTATQRVTEAILTVQGEASSESAFVVERAWVQTWISKTSGGIRLDRAVFQVASHRRELEITLPEGAIRDQASVQLNGVPIAAQPRNERSLLVPLSSDAASPRYVIELRYAFSGDRPPRGKIAFDFPSLGEDVWVRRIYWQLLLPPDEHVIATPRDMTSEFTWAWNTFYYGRQPVLTQEELEAWAGLRHPGASPAPVGENCYLYSSIGKLPPCEIRTASRSMIVLCASGATLLIGLALIYFRAARSPASLLIFVVVLGGLAVNWPDLAAIAAEASAVGVGLSLLAALLRQLTAARPPRFQAESASTLAAIVVQPAPAVESTANVEFGHGAVASASSSTATLSLLHPKAAP